MSEENSIQSDADRAETQCDHLMQVRPAGEWCEDMGPVLWWRFPISEAPYLGTPLDCGQTVEVEVRHYGACEEGEEPAPGLLVALKTTIHRHQVGGWPGYHTHFSPIPRVQASGDSTEPHQEQREIETNKGRQP